MCTFGPHILVYPFPTSGHTIPMLDLAHDLLTRGLIVTVLITPNNLPLLDWLRSRHPSCLLQILILPEPGSSTNSSTHRIIFKVRSLHELHAPALRNWFKSHPSPPVAIISDFFLGWTQKLASEFGIPRILFSPSGAFGLWIILSLWRDLPENSELDNLNFQVSFQKIPNRPIQSWYQLPHVYRTYKQGDPDHELYRNSMLANLSSWGVVFNSFTELERVYLDHVKEEMGHHRVWAVGPLLPSNYELARSMSRGRSNSVPCEEVLTWLDSRRDHSVLYVCFGSEYVLTTKQMNALAAALEKSGVHFLWSVRQTKDGRVADDHGVIPDGFEDRVGGRGFIISEWAPQLAILRHTAVTAFLSHCGWNSILEGISAGLVMLTWPMTADQYSNSHLLVDELGLGIRVREGTQKIPESTELGRLLYETVNGTRPERVKARELGCAAISAVMKGGSSDRDFDDFIRNINQ